MTKPINEAFGFERDAPAAPLVAVVEGDGLVEVEDGVCIWSVVAEEGRECDKDPLVIYRSEVCTSEDGLDRGEVCISSQVLAGETRK